VDHHAGNDRPEPDLRVGDADRTAALDALGVHLGAGRLDVDEFGDRSERAAVAVHRSDLEALFTDLPGPHPPLPRLPAPVEDAAIRARPVPGPPRHPGPGPAFAVVMVLVLLLPLIAAGIGTGSFGGFLILPLLFVALGHARRGRWHGRGPGGPGGPGGPYGGPRDRW
jgi:hypothetical protein